MARSSKTVIGASAKRARYLLRDLKEVSQTRALFIDLDSIDSIKTYESFAGRLVVCVLVE